MRKGDNPIKIRNQKEGIAFYHRVIIPVYIPNLEGYFIDSLKILDLCISSIYKTVSLGTAITVIDNACCTEIKNYLKEKFEDGIIDQLIIQKYNLGKVDPLMSVIRGSHEDLITITDADVLFKNGWLQAIEDIFKAFPKAGMISSTPSPLGYMNGCNSTFIDNIFSSHLRFRKLTDKQDMQMFEQSIGRIGMYKDVHHNFQLSIERNGKMAIVGCGHFVLTCRREAFKISPKHPSKYFIEGNSEVDYIDTPNDKAGFWKLATPTNYTYHLGNVYEAWMNEYFNNIQENRIASNFQLPKHSISKFQLNYRLKNKLIEMIFKKPKLRKYFFKKWGATFNPAAY